MRITYLYHSGFAVETGDVMLVFDYYRGTLPETAKGERLYVFSSHRHKDHFQPQIFDWVKDYDVTYILSDDICAEGPEGKTRKVRPGEEYEIGELKIKTLRSTDEGVAFLVRLADVTVYHAGDLNWWHWEEESASYNEKMAREYKQEIDSIEGEHIDAAFVPLDPRLGGAWGWGIDYFMRHTDTAHLFPMHLWGGYKKIRKFKEEALTEDYRDRIVQITGRGESFEL